jgi:hypothetical protein
MRPYGKSNSISTGFSLADSGPLLKIGHNPLPNDLHGLSTNDCYHCYVWVISLFAKMHYVKDKLGRSRKGDNMPIDNIKNQMMTVSEVSSIGVHPCG